MRSSSVESNSHSPKGHAASFFQPEASLEEDNRGRDVYFPMITSGSRMHAMEEGQRNCLSKALSWTPLPGLSLSAVKKHWHLKAGGEEDEERFHIMRGRSANVRQPTRYEGPETILCCRDVRPARNRAVN